MPKPSSAPSKLPTAAITLMATTQLERVRKNAIALMVHEFPDNDVEALKYRLERLMLYRNTLAEAGNAHQELILKITHKTNELENMIAAHRINDPAEDDEEALMFKMDMR